MNFDSEMAVRFVCAKCQSHGAKVTRIASTGTGITRLINLQCHQFVAASCQTCGYTEMYNPAVFEQRLVGMDLFDMLFGS